MPWGQFFTIILQVVIAAAVGFVISAAIAGARRSWREGGKK